MTAKEYLTRYRYAALEARAIEKELENLRSSLGILSLESSIKLSDYQWTLEEQLTDRLKVLEEISMRIEQQEHEIDRAILRMRYISLMKWEEIAEELSYTVRHTTRLHGIALGRFSM